MLEVSEFRRGNISTPKLPTLSVRQTRHASSHNQARSLSVMDPLPVSKERELYCLRRGHHGFLQSVKPRRDAILRNIKKWFNKLKKQVILLMSKLMAELRRQQKARLEKEQRDQLYEASSNVWQTYVLPNWDAAYRPSINVLM